MDKYIELTESAKKHKSVYHYTSLDALKCILDNQSLRLSRIDTVNDSKENDRIKSLWNAKVFLLCFTHEDNNSEYFYKEYGEIRLEFKRENIVIDKLYYESELKNSFTSFDNYVRRSQINHKSYENKADWCVYDISIADIYYTDDLNSHISTDGFESNAGLIKAKKGVDDCGNERNWNLEAETRIRVALRPIGQENILDRKTNEFYCPVPKFECIYMRLPIITKISISPYISEDEKNRIIKTLKNYGLIEKIYP